MRDGTTGPRFAGRRGPGAVGDRPPGTGRRHGPGRAVAALICLAAALGTSACASPAEVAPPPAATSPACTTIAWPTQVAGASRTPTTPQSPATAAWATRGDPAIIARCGVAVPGPTTNPCLGVDAVDWVSERLDDGMRFTTYGRDPAVEVLVPARYAPEPLVLSAFTTAAAAGAPTGHHCS